MSIKNLFMAAALALAVACTSSRTTVPIKTEVPAREAYQQDVIGLTVPAMDTVRIGFVGLGMRGSGAVSRYTYVPGVKIVALCDVEPDRVAAAQKTLEGRAFPKAAEYSGSLDAYKQLCERDDIDLVYICTDWIHHAEVAICAMEHGKNAAIEVPAATSLKECWDLVNTSEKTRKHCMMLENCCYDFFELSCLAMAQAGVFGEVLHVEGSYLHWLDPYWDEYWNNWRLDFNHTHRGDVYPTHGLGPICQVLGIHRGDRMKTLVAMDTKAVNGPARVKMQTGKECDDFMNYAAKYPIQQISVGSHDVLGPEAVRELQEKHPSPILTPELVDLAKTVGGHGGMDFIMDYRLIYCLRNGLPLDMDVYDLAEWCCLGELGSISIENGNAPVEVPDFTRGAWNKLKGFSYAFAQ